MNWIEKLIIAALIGFVISVGVTHASIGDDVNNSWGDTLAEGGVEYISHVNSVERVIGCSLMVQAPARGYDGESLLAWELYDVCKNESIDMGMVEL